MRQSLENIYHLGLKELQSLRSDAVLVLVIIYIFTVAVYTVATGASIELKDASVAIVDEDRSPLSERLGAALMSPYFRPPEQIGPEQVAITMNSGRYTFVIEVPPRFQSDVLAGRKPALQLAVDATAISQAGIGAVYIQRILAEELLGFTTRRDGDLNLPVSVVIRAKFNPNLNSQWFNAVMQIINNITILAVVLAGAALIREREHGTVEHLLVMPLRPVEIMLAKVWANGLVIVVAAILSLYLVVQLVLAVPIAGSIKLFVVGSVFYLFSVTALGILLATLARSMPQFGLLAMPVLIIINLLSGSTTPLDSMPRTLQILMQISPSTHFVSFAQAIIYRGAGFEVVWPKFVALIIIGGIFFGAALLRFRKAIVLN